jgi:hypothetical protein
VDILAEDRATAAEVLRGSKGANWIHFALPLVGGDPHISDWVSGSGNFGSICAFVPVKQVN